jgi:protein O-GlcNAc transferase
VKQVRALLERAIALEQRGDHAAARAIYTQVLVEAPEHPGALLKLALFEQAAGAFDAAQALLERALHAARTARTPALPIWLAIAGLRESANDAAGARAAYAQVLGEAPGHPAARFGLGLLALREGDAAAAEGHLRAVLAQQPDNAGARAQLAAALFAQGAADAAAAELVPAIAAAPASVPLRHLAATVAIRRGDFAAAVAHCRAGLAVAPAHGTLLILLSRALRSSGALGAAALALGDAAAASPDDAAAWLAYGNVCMEAELARVEVARGPAGESLPEEAPSDLLERAMAAFSRAAALQPDAAAPHAHLAMAARYACAWPRATAAVESLVARHALDPAHCACSPMMAVALLSDPLAQRAAIAGWTRQTLPAPQAPAKIAQRGHRLRVGYLSSDLHDHATAHLMAGLFDAHDQARVETFAYAADRDDGSAMRQRLRQAFTHWRDIRTLADEPAAQLIAADALDVLVDLKGHTHGTRIALLARRPAPVQLHYLGFPGTIAYDAIDGFIADDIVAPAGCEPEFAESLLRLPVCYQANDRRRLLPAVMPRSAVGLPERALVLACFNQTYKLTEPFMAIWLDVLREQADAVLWLWVPHALAQHNLRGYATRAGVASERIVFAPAVPHAEHMARLRCADLALDVLPYGSHTSGSDALWAGVPLLTCRGTTFAGRVGASLCHAAGLPELVTDSLAGYARELRSLCGDRGRLAHHQRHLAAERERLPLFDTEAFTRAFERLLEDAANGPSGR